MHEVDLAWALISATLGGLDAAERIDAHVAVGSGDADAAIRRLTAVALKRQIPMSHELALALRNWWAAHAGGTQEFLNLIAELREQPDAPAKAVERKPSRLTVTSRYEDPGAPLPRKRH